MRLTITYCLLLLTKVVLTQDNNNLITTIDDTSFGKLGFIGNYAGISNTKNRQQPHYTIDQSILLRQNNTNSEFEEVVQFGGNITSSCTLQNYIYFAGEFQYVNQTNLVNHIVKLNTDTNTIESLSNGLNGPVYTIYCDEMDEIIYMGGNFSSPIETNATISTTAGNVASWSIKNNTWAMLPWKGFNGPVYTITKNKKSNAILFGGRFDATVDGQFFNSNTSQLVSMSSPTSISSGNGGFNSDPNSIVCPAKASPEAVGDPWYLQDGVPGYWDANFAGPTEPTVFRLSNTHTEKGTLSFNILALGLNEYYNLSYVDPSTQQTVTCSEDCRLSNDTYQDFTVLNALSANGIRININSWFGSGGGLGYVQIFQSDISVNPHLNLNDTQCNSGASSTQTTITGNWKDVYVYGYYQTVLVADVSYSELSTSNTAIVYQPNIPAQGQYEVYATTPGCVGSSNCFTRTQVEYQLQLSPDFPAITILSDQNVYNDNRFLLYSGIISPVSTNFRPSITLKPASNATQSSGGSDTVQIMAATIEFVRNMTGTPLVSVLEYKPAEATNTSAISWKPLNQQLPLGSTVYSLDASDGDTLYIGGLFSSTNSTGFKNVISYSNTLGQLIPLDSLSGGVNGKVSTLLFSNPNLYLGGEFNTTVSPTSTSLKNVAQFNTQQKSWSPLGDGVDGSVTHILLSIDNSSLTISGQFNNRFNAPDSFKPSTGNAVWSTANNTWIERSSLIVGQITTDEKGYFAGAIVGAQTYRADLVTSSDLANSRFIFNVSGTVSAGVTWINNSTNEASTIIASSSGSNKSVVAIYNNKTNQWTDIDDFQGQVNTLATFQQWLFVGGQFTPQRNQSASLSIYDMSKNNSILGVHSVTDASGNPGSISIIKIHPDGKRVLIGGSFSKVGLLDCAALCALDPSTRQWDDIAIGLSGTVNDILTYSNDNDQKVTVIGDLMVQNQPTSIASVSNTASTWTAETIQLPGTPFTAINSVNNEIIFAGSNTNGMQKRQSDTNIPNNFFVGTMHDQTYTSLISNLGQGSNISQLLLVPVSSSSEQRYPTGTQNMLLAVGNININEYGNVSAALYDGTLWSPYLSTTQINGQIGIINKVIHVTDFNGIKNGRRYLSVAAVILISIGISTGILFAMSSLGLLFLFKKHKGSQTAGDMPPWSPSSRMIDAFGLFGTGSLGAATIAATAAAGGTRGMIEASTTGRNTAAGPSYPINRSTFLHDEAGDMGISPTATIVNPIPITAAAAAAGALSFGAMVASAKANTTDTVSETHPKLFQAKYNFKAQEYGELSLDAGDNVVVTDTTDNIWWLGYKDGGSNRPVSGVFPSNYLKT